MVSPGQKYLLKPHPTLPLPFLLYPTPPHLHIAPLFVAWYLVSSTPLTLMIQPSTPLRCLPYFDDSTFHPSSLSVWSATSHFSFSQHAYVAVARLCPANIFSHVTMPDMRNHDPAMRQTLLVTTYAEPSLIAFTYTDAQQIFHAGGRWLKAKALFEDVIALNKGLPYRNCEKYIAGSSANHSRENPHPSPFASLIRSPRPL